MPSKHLTDWMIVVVFSLALVACAPTATPTAAPTVTPPPTATATATRAPSPTATPTATATATPTATPTITPAPKPTATPTAPPTPNPEIQIPGYNSIKEITGSQPLPESFDVSKYIYPNPNNLLGWIEKRANGSYVVANARLNHLYEAVNNQGKKVAMIDVSFIFKGTRIMPGDNKKHRIIFVVNATAINNITQSDSSVMPTLGAQLLAGTTIDLGYLFLNETELQKALETDGPTVVVVNNNLSIGLVSNNNVDIRISKLNSQTR